MTGPPPSLSFFFAGALPSSGRGLRPRLGLRVLRQRPPSETSQEPVEHLEFATLEWVDWFNTRRLLEPIGYVPPAEFEEAYHQQQAKPPAGLALT